MIKYLLITLIIFIIILLYCFILLKKRFDDYKRTTKLGKDINTILLDENEKLKSESKALSIELDKYKTDLTNVENQIANAKIRANEIEQLTEQNIQNQKQIINQTTTLYKTEAINRVDAEVNLERHNRLAAILNEEITYRGDLEKQTRQFKENIEIYKSLSEDAVNEFDCITAELNALKAHRDSINEEIRRSKMLELEQDAHRILLTEDDKQDIEYLLNIIPNLKHREILYKLIWSEYIQKPFNQMLKNVLGGRSPKNVIYMIRNLKTNEIYIGKTKQEVSKRWTDHIKTSLYIGTQTPKNIHKAMYNNWDGFSFEIVEEVNESTDLSEKESYYINFYESNIYGYNMIK